MGWIAVGLHIFLAATFGYFAFKKHERLFNMTLDDP
jgi:hypothetical protein